MPHYPNHEATHALRSQNYVRLRTILKDIPHDSDDEALFDPFGIHVFNLAGKHGNLEGLRICLKAGCKPNRLYNGFYALHSAAIHGHTEACRLLRAWKANLEVRSPDGGHTALLLAAIAGHTATVLALARLGANVHARTDDGATALMLAATHGHNETVQALVKLKVDVNAVNEDGLTALMYATTNGHLETVKILVAAGANIFATSRKHQTAVAMATAIYLDAESNSIERREACNRVIDFLSRAFQAPANLGLSPS